MNIIDQCVAQGVPFAREYGGLLANRSFGGAQVSRTFYARGQTGQQLLLGAYQALEKEIAKGGVTMFPRTEMLDLVVVERARARDRDARHGDRRDRDASRRRRDARHRRLRQRLLSVDERQRARNATAIWRAYKRGAAFANPCFTQIHPTCIPVSGEHQSKLTLMSESLRNDGRVWVPKRKEDCPKPPRDIPETDRDYYLERKYPSFGNLSPRDIASRAAKEVCDEGRGVGPGGRGVYLDFGDAIRRLGQDTIAERYGNLFEMYERITDENPYEVPMRIYPAVHYTMGGLWVDYNLMSTIPGLHVIGEANFSDHGANRLGASALMQGLADGYFVVPHDDRRLPRLDQARRRIAGRRTRCARRKPTWFARTERLLAVKGKRTVTSFHRELGQIMWEYCGMARDAAGLNDGARADSEAARRVLAATCACPAPARSSTSRSSTPGASPISSSSAS